MPKLTAATYPTVTSPATDDLLMLVDVSNQDESAQGTTSKVTVGNLLGLGLTLQASTGADGFALENDTPDILTWTPPDDGQLHWVVLFAAMDVTEDQTDGVVAATITLPDGTYSYVTLFAGGLSSGFQGTYAQQSAWPQKAGTEVTIFQYSAQSAGAATLWAGIWGL